MLTDPGQDALDDTVDADPVHVAAVHHGETERFVVQQVGPVVQRPADADVRRAVLDQQALFGGPPERRAVRARRTEIRVPGVQVRIEVHQRRRVVGLEQPGGLPDRGGPEPGARAVGDAAVERHPHDGDVVVGHLVALR